MICRKNLKTKLFPNYFVDDTVAAGGVKIGQRYVTPTGNLKK
jgi:hypothetical protein